MRSFFGADSDFERRLPARWMVADGVVALMLTGLAVLGVLTYNTLPSNMPVRLWPSIASIVVAGVLITLRRRFPVAVLVLGTGVHFLVIGILLREVVVQPAMQVLYFLGLYSAMAWARRREALMMGVAVVLLAMTAWVALSYSASAAEFQASHGTSPALWLIYSTALNVAYFGGAMWLGRNAWLHARDEAALQESREVVEAQSRQLADQAVVGERLRIARDLHDSVAHHVSLIGIQASAARRSMLKQPDAAAEALRGVESAARQAVSELRGVLGSLRHAGAADTGTLGLDALPSLVADSAEHGLAVAASHVGDSDGLDRLTATQSSTLYRVVQEALTNVRKHSTATAAQVVLRLGPAHVEVEIIDDGRPVTSGGGSGLGHVGIRERVAALGGTVDIGPRVGQGYRVLARIPLQGGAA